MERSFLPRIRRAAYVIGVDRGAYWLTCNKMVPDMAIGDFDSVTKSEFTQIQKIAKNVIVHPEEKDATDLGLAVDFALTGRPEEVWIFGAIGTRFDHVWAGIHLLARLASHNVCGYLVDKTNEIQIVRREATLTRSRLFKYVSIFPLGKSATVTLTGFSYNVTKRIFTRESTLGVSNEIPSGTAHITVHKGNVVLIRSRD